ncbi:hypothetical protein MRS44_016165 [Fusarium solani]|jgi:hypothetical protein|uniref:uncharacterized protein n=1 Tax=Fusarium solani TaxID=169388 RepID=UPI0032C3FCEB|nr:hypothetical protein MRS44_016165 [Fusarium solani]
MLWRTAVLASFQAILVVLADAKVPSPAKSLLPSINVTLTPFLNTKNATIRGKVVLDSHVAKNETLVALPLTMAGQPSAQYTKKSLKAFDSHGPLELSQVDGSAIDGTPSRFWVAERGTKGPIVVEFEAKPRQVQENTKMGPLFDIRQNGQGLLGSAWALVPLPPNDTAEYHFSLKWNLQHSPPGSKGVWTWGESPETVRVNGTTSTFLYTFWMVGPVSSYPGTSSSSAVKPLSPNFGMYWLQDPPFDVETTASFIDRFFNYSSEFWKDPGTQPYRVFIRHNDNVGSGGTALTRSFTFGWFNESSTTEEGLKFLLAHEITHNWPSISTGNDSAISRYAEGTAEYYSQRLLWRNGQISAEVYLQEMNKRIKTYYINPYVNISDKEAYDQSWIIPQAQTIPYGRGLIYLTNVDGEMRATSNGTESLDTITLSLIETCRSIPSRCSEAELRSLLNEYLSQAAVAEYEVVGTGKPLIKPSANSLGPCFEVVQTSTQPVVYQWKLKEGKDGSDRSCLI